MGREEQGRGESRATQSRWGPLGGSLLLQAPRGMFWGAEHVVTGPPTSGVCKRGRPEPRHSGEQPGARVGQEEACGLGARSTRGGLQAGRCCVRGGAELSDCPFPTSTACWPSRPLAPSAPAGLSVPVALPAPRDRPADPRAPRLTRVHTRARSRRRGPRAPGAGGSCSPRGHLHPPPPQAPPASADRLPPPPPPAPCRSCSESPCGTAKVAEEPRAVEGPSLTQRRDQPT